MKIFKNNERKQIFLSGLLLVIIIALYVEINVLISKANIKSIDITQDKVYTISDISKEKISNLKKPVKITLINFNKYSNYTYADDALYIAKQFDEYSDLISIEYYDDNTDDKTNTQYPYMIFTCDNNSRQVSLEELYQYRYNTAYGNQEDMYIVEPMIINSIQCVSEDSWNNIYICLDKTVYTEKMFSSFVNISSVLGADVFSLNLSDDKEIPENCDVLVIPPLVKANEDGTMMPVDFSDEEKDIIVDYINKGGNILFLQESKSVVNGETPNLDYLLNIYGVTISDGIICQENDIIQGIPSYIHPKINTDNTIVKSINNKMVSVFDAGQIIVNNDEQSNIKYQVILEANESAFLRKDITNSSFTKTESDEDAKGMIIGLYAEKNTGDNTSRAIIYSNSVFVTNSPVVLADALTSKNLAIETIILDNNSELTADSIRALMNDNNVVFETKCKYNMIPSQNLLTDGITLKVVFAIPMVILLIGYAVWRHRKNKK